MSKCLSVIHDFKKDQITYQRDQRQVGCVMMFEDIYDAHVESICRVKKSIFDQLYPRHLKYPQSRISYT